MDAVQIGAMTHFVRDINRDVLRPAFNNVEADNADRVLILTGRRSTMTVSKSVVSASVSGQTRPFPTPCKSNSTPPNRDSSQLVAIRSGLGNSYCPSRLLPAR